MKKDIFLTLIISVVIEMSVAANPVIITTLGPVEGLQTLLLNKTLNVFYGIPFAKPPIGNLRFKRPEIPEPWTETKMTISLPHSCHQIVDESFNQSAGVDMWNPKTPMSEDCLYLNVWQPKPVSSNEKMAVMVWIYGGTFSGGTTTLDAYNGMYLAIRNNVIVVSMNYRVGVLGFLYLENEQAPGNVGLLDQSLAIKWVYDNVDKFGGDKNRITLFGESAGAASVHFHLLSEKSRDYFNNAIMESSTALCYWATQSNMISIQRAQLLAKKVGCVFDNKEAMFDCLATRDAHTLVTKQWEVTEYYFDAPFAPVVDGYFLTDDPESLLEKGNTKNTSIMLGVNKDEGSYFLLYGIPEFFQLANPNPLTREDFLNAQKTVISPLDNENVMAVVTHSYETSFVPTDLPSYRNILDDISGDRAFKCPTIDTARIYAELGNDVYLYSFEYRPSYTQWPLWMGVPHGYEIELVFGITTDGSERYNTKDVVTSITMMGLWSGFAKTGNGSGVWPKYTVETQSYLQFDENGNVNTRTGLRHSQCALWRDVIPILSKEAPSTGEGCVSGGRRRQLDTSWLILIAVLSFVIQIIQPERN